MAGYRVVRDALVATMSAVPNIGVVHAYQRYTGNLSDYLSLFRTTIDGVPQIRAWFVTLERTDSRWAAIPPSLAVETRWTFVIYGFLSVDDGSATEETMLELTETVMAAINASLPTVPGVLMAGPADLRRYDAIVRFGETVTHRVTLAVPVIIDGLAA